MAVNLFCSYSRKDGDYAKKIVEFVASHGYAVWMDQSGIDGASIWTETIVEAIDESAAVILLVSNHSVHSPHVLKEISLSVEKGKIVFPLMIGKTDLPRTFQYLLAGIQQIELGETLFSHDNAREKLIKSLEAHLEVDREVIVDEITKDNHISNREAPLNNSIAVLPLRSISPNKDYHFIAEALSDSVITNLGKVEGVKVLSRQSILGYNADKDSVLTVSSKFGVKFILEGSVLCSGKQILVNASLFNSEEEDIVWSESYEKNIDEAISLIRALALGISTAIKAKLTTGDKNRLEGGQNIESRVYKLITIARKNRLIKSEDGLAEAIKHLKEAIKIDSQNIQTKSELLLSYILGVAFGHFELSSKLSEEITELENYLSLLSSCPAEGLIGRSLKLELLDSNIKAAENVLREALALNPSNREIAQELAFFLGRKGDFQEAFSIMENSVHMEEEELHSMNALGYLSFYCGNYLDSVKYMEKVLEIDEKFYPALIILAISHGELLDFENSKKTLDKISQSNPTVESQMGYLFAKQNLITDARDRITKLDTDFPTHPFKDYAKSIIFLAIGDIDESVEILQKSANINGFVPRDLTLGNDPRISLLKHHPEANLIKGLSFTL